MPDKKLLKLLKIKKFLIRVGDLSEKKNFCFSVCYAAYEFVGADRLQQ